MKDTMDKFGRFLEKKQMMLSSEKSKIIEPRKGGGRQKKKTVKWKDQNIEQVKEVKYLGYYFQKNNRDKHIIKRLKKVTNLKQRLTKF